MLLRQSPANREPRQPPRPATIKIVSDATKYRLSADVVPHSYDLVLEPDLDAGTLTGQVTVHVEIATATNTVVLNSEDLTIARADIEAQGQTMSCQVSVDPDNERIALTVDQELQPGPATVSISFAGAFNENLVGPYLSTFVDADGATQKLATTQFEATHARKCFPCWDEPDFKATFAVTLVIPPGLDAVSNGPEVGREERDGKIRVSFAPTIAMSTYLVAFVVGPIETSEPVDVDGVPLRIVHVPGKAELTDFALEVGAFALRYFSDYFGLPYPGQKLDLVAIPDFAFGAMENLGCVTFRETLLLVDPAQATQPELQRAADVINHEIAHMWFGDLVTMKWWNGLWLNEAFATFMEMRCTDAFRPDWGRWTDFGISRSAAFATDSLASTRPIEYEVISPVEAEGMFDILTYEKGAAVVRMLEQFLGEEKFRAGIRRYMQEHQFDNADTPDLWAAIEAEAGEPVSEIMHSWIYQGGFPQVSVTASSQGPVVTQEPLQLLGADEVPDQQWLVPIEYRWVRNESTQPDDQSSAGSAQPPSSHLLLGEQPVAIDGAANTEANLLVNANGSGFFRVRYTADALDDLTVDATENLTAVERYSLIDDAWASVLAGQISTVSFLTLLEAMTAESNRSVWQRIIAGFQALSRLVDGEARERLNEIVHDAVAPTLAGLGLEGREDDTDQQRQLRADLFRALGTLANDPEIQELAKQISAEGLRNPELVDTSLLAAATDIVAARGDAADYDDFLNASTAATTPQAELRYLGALMDFSSSELHAKTWSRILDGTIRTQNGPLLLRRGLLNEHCGRETWAFIAENWETLNNIFASSLIVRMVEGVNVLNLPADQEAVADFFSSHSVPSGERTLSQVLERQRVNVTLRERQSGLLSQFLTA